jgi:hypothetical protein
MHTASVPKGGRALRRDRRGGKRAKGTRKMIRNLKALGLALVAVFAMSAMAASAAQAEEADFFTGDTPGTFRAGEIDAVGHGTQLFETKFGTLSCEEVRGTATLAEESGTLTGENIEYTDCDANGTFPVGVDMNGCHYTFDAGTMTGDESATGSVIIEGCSSGGITIYVYAFGTSTEEVHNETGTVICEIHVPGQTPTEGPVSYENVEDPETGKDAVTVEAEEVKVHAESTAGGICANDVDTNAVYTGGFTATAEDHETFEPIDAAVTGTP